MSNEVDNLEPIVQCEVKSEREKQMFYTNTYIWNLERQYWWNYLQDSDAVHGVAKSQTRLSDFTFTFHFHALEKEMATHSRFFPGESQGQGSLVGCRFWGLTESDMTEVT